MAIIAGGGDNQKLRLELSRGRGRMRCSQGQTAGSGVRPDCLPAAYNLYYLGRGA